MGLGAYEYQALSCIAGMVVAFGYKGVAAVWRTGTGTAATACDAPSTSCRHPT
jgi:hypothetical protein